MLKNNIPVQNNDEFPETYGVKEGNGMYPAPEGNIRVWWNETRGADARNMVISQYNIVILTANGKIELSFGSMNAGPDDQRIFIPAQMKSFTALERCMPVVETSRQTSI